MSKILPVSATKSRRDDALVKKSLSLFAEDILPFLGIYQNVTSIGAPPACQTAMPDYTFLLEDGGYIHFEFQCADHGADDLRRYRVYEAQLSAYTQKDVTTYVIYTGNIIAPMTTRDTGVSHYVVRKITMEDYDAPQVLMELNRQVDAGEPLPPQTAMILAFISTMGGELSPEQAFAQAIALSGKIKEPLIKFKTQHLLYGFTSKLFTATALDMLKEEWKMTELGQALYHDGVQQATEKIATALLDILNDNMIAAKTGLTLTAVRKLRRQEKEQEKTLK